MSYIAVILALLLGIVVGFLIGAFIMHGIDKGYIGKGEIDV